MAIINNTNNNNNIPNIKRLLTKPDRYEMENIIYYGCFTSILDIEYYYNSKTLKNNYRDRLILQWLSKDGDSHLWMFNKHIITIIAQYADIYKICPCCDPHRTPPSSSSDENE